MTPFAGVPACKGWDGLVTADGAVWSVIPRENRIESAHFYARSGDGWFDLGPGNAGSLVWCAVLVGVLGVARPWRAMAGLTAAGVVGAALLFVPRVLGA